MSAFDAGIEVGQVWEENGHLWLILCAAASSVQSTWRGWQALDLENGTTAYVLAIWLLAGRRTL